MPLPPSTTDVERRKKVRIRIRHDLEIEPQKYEGRTYYVVKDPVSLRLPLQGAGLLSSV